LSDVSCCVSAHYTCAPFSLKGDGHSLFATIFFSVFGTKRSCLASAKENLDLYFRPPSLVPALFCPSPLDPSKAIADLSAPPLIFFCSIWLLPAKGLHAVSTRPFRPLIPFTLLERHWTLATVYIYTLSPPSTNTSSRRFKKTFVSSFY